MTRQVTTSKITETGHILLPPELDYVYIFFPPICVTKPNDVLSIYPKCNYETLLHKICDLGRLYQRIFCSSSYFLNVTKRGLSFPQNSGLQEKYRGREVSIVDHDDHIDLALRN